jgi:hypothetical protein
MSVVGAPFESSVGCLLLSAYGRTNGVHCAAMTRVARPMTTSGLPVPQEALGAWRSKGINVV